MSNEKLKTSSNDNSTVAASQSATPIKAIFWGIFFGILFGSLIGGAVGIFLRPKQELDDLSQEWLDDLKDVTEQVSDTVRHKVTELVSKRRERAERYEEYPESYV